ncbi:MAG: copper amine oxidase N-terminal domain-containing protein [Syntrophomonadaceae bacterium]|jgi:hypothetical protein|nr:copper amine oxidase N-terminal domain-containing protein [Syntrophomonadaceae bacterium]
MQKFTKIKYFLLGVLLTAVFSSTISPAIANQVNRKLDATYNNIKIVVDGETIDPRDANGNVVEPFIVDGTTYLPVRPLCEAVGYNLKWDGSTQTVYVYSSYNYEEQWK